MAPALQQLYFHPRAGKLNDNVYGVRQCSAHPLRSERKEKEILEKIQIARATHATDCEGVPGVTKLQGVRRLVIDDLDLESRTKIDISVNN